MLAIATDPSGLEVADSDAVDVVVEGLLIPVFALTAVAQNSSNWPLGPR